MALEAVTKDTAQLDDGEIADIAAMCAADDGFEAGMINKEAENWVLVTTVTEGAHLRAFSFSTLERIGGTPAILLGMAGVRRHSRRDAALRAVMAENFRRALRAFPDEDVLVGACFQRPDAFDAFRSLSEVVPRPGHRPSGEDRAWGRRLAKRFGVNSAHYDDREFAFDGTGSQPISIDFETLKVDAIPSDLAAMFESIDIKRGDAIIAHGWVMSEELLKYG